MTSTVEDLIEQIRELPVWERRRLIGAILDTLRDESAEPNLRNHSITELRGLGKELWEGVDAQAYINQIRGEWDERP